MRKSGVFLTDTEGELVEVDPRDPLVMLDITWRARRMKAEQMASEFADGMRQIAEQAGHSSADAVQRPSFVAFNRLRSPSNASLAVDPAAEHPSSSAT